MSAGTRYQDRHVFTIHAMLLEGKTDTDIITAVNISRETFYRWKKKPLMKLAYAHVAECKKQIQKFKGRSSLKEFIYGHLPDDLKPIWDEINEAEEIDAAKNPRGKIELLLRNKGKQARQTLFLHAWFESNFNESAACRKIGISVEAVTLWKQDPDFLRLFQQMDKIKGDFFESQLVQLAREGNPAVVVFANKTYNRSRGYGETIDVNMSGSVDVTSSYLPIDELDLDVETKKKLLVAMRKLKEEKGELLKHALPAEEIDG